MTKIKKIILAKPRGFCAGVERAVRVVKECLDIFGAPVYVKHQIVHNATVVADLESKGAITVENIDDIPEGSVVVFSAHGSPPKHYAEAEKRGLRIIDATCPLVTKVHLEVHRYLKGGYDIIYIGHKGHIEGEGVRAEAISYGKEVPIVDTIEDVEEIPKKSSKCVYLTQTTLSIAETRDIILALKRRFPQIEAPPIQDICYATTNRQMAVRALAKKVDIVLVVGSTNSSNSNRLVEVARAEGVEAHLVEDLIMVQSLDFKGKECVGITAGASAPEPTVRAIADYFVALGAKEEVLDAVVELMHFADPLEMQKMRKEEL